MAEGLGFRDRSRSVKFRVLGFWCRDLGLGFKDLGLGFRDWGLGFKDWAWSCTEFL